MGVPACDVKALDGFQGPEILGNVHEWFYTYRTY